MGTQTNTMDQQALSSGTIVLIVVEKKHKAKQKHTLPASTDSETLRSIKCPVLANTMHCTCVENCLPVISCGPRGAPAAQLNTLELHCTV